VSAARLKGRGREIQRQIARILAEDWDPISVRGEPEAKGEYDMYVGGIYGLLARGATTIELAEHLESIEREKMGFPHSRAAHLLPIAERLRAVDIRLEP
jgi:hypothetical protein